MGGLEAGREAMREAIAERYRRIWRRCYSVAITGSFAEEVLRQHRERALVAILNTQLAGSGLRARQKRAALARGRAPASPPDRRLRPQAGHTGSRIQQFLGARTFPSGSRSSATAMYV